MNLIIRSEKNMDRADIEAVTVAAFLHAPHTDHNEQFIIAALRTAGALTVSLVAELERQLVGYVAVSPVSIADGAQGWFGVGPVAVIPTLQAKGIGSQLIHQALETLRAQGASGCVVLGDPSYYKRFGFKHEPTLKLPGVPSEYFMAVSFGAPLPSGVVTYHPAFSSAG